MPEITPIQPTQVNEVKRMIYTVARDIFHPGSPLDETIAAWEADGELADLDDVWHNYFNNGGTFCDIYIRIVEAAAAVRSRYFIDRSANAVDGPLVFKKWLCFPDGKTTNDFQADT